MPTYYVEDYDGERNDDAAEPLTLTPVVEDGAPVAKVVEPETKRSPAKKTSRAKTKS